MKQQVDEVGCHLLSDPDMRSMICNRISVTYLPRARKNIMFSTSCIFLGPYFPNSYPCISLLWQYPYTTLPFPDFIPLNLQKHPPLPMYCPCPWSYVWLHLTLLQKCNNKVIRLRKLYLWACLPLSFSIQSCPQTNL